MNEISAGEGPGKAQAMSAVRPENKTGTLRLTARLDRTPKMFSSEYWT